MPPIRPTRQSITHKQRACLREASKRNPGWKQAHLAHWAEGELGLKLSQSTISESLGSRYAFLDQQIDSRAISDAKRLRAAEHPLLEAALDEYLSRINSQGLTVTGEVIQTAARLLWQKMPDFSGLEEPKFSRGWLDGFKTRYSYKFRRKHGEIGSANAIDFSDDLEAIQQVISSYESEDIYNVDETGLFWRQSPSTTLSKQPISGVKREKQRLSLVPCVNATGTHKLQLWVIGKAKNPRPFGRNNRNITGLPVHWRFNKKAWMTSVIFKEWLFWFDSQMTGRKVLLLLDNFSAHEKAGNEAIDEGLLHNTRLLFLPPNSTSLFQPLDQGIIHNLKLLYRKVWLEFVIQRSFQGRDPLDLISQLQALYWIIEAWQDVKVSTIANCWRKSQLFGQPFGPEPQPEGWDADRIALYQLAVQARIQTTMRLGFVIEMDALDSFIEPEEERLFDPEDDLLDHIAMTFSQLPDEDIDDDLDGLLPRQISMAEVSSALETLIAYEEQTEDYNYDFIQRLKHEEKRVWQRWREEREATQSQSSIEKYLRPIFPSK